MRKNSFQILLIVLLLAMIGLTAQAQDKIMRVHSGGNVVYETNTARVDSIIFEDGILPKPLINTKWKLNGIVDAETSVVTELEPKACKDCYTLSFGTDYTALAHGIEYSALLDLINLGDYEISKLWLLHPEYYDEHPYEEGFEFYKAVLTTKSCVVEDYELRLYYGDKKSYLCFSPFVKSEEDERDDLIASNLAKQGEVNSASLFRSWDFVTYAYTEDGITISDIPTEPKGHLQISRASLDSSPKSGWTFMYGRSIYFETSLSGNLLSVELVIPSTPISDPDEKKMMENMMNALRNAYSYVIKDKELIIYFKNAADKNILIFKKQ